MPKLWNETIEAHKLGVRSAIMDTAASLVVEHGLLSVTMSQIAEATDIGRATLYKYFPDVETILHAWHEERISEHLQQLDDVRDRVHDPRERLQAVLEAFAFISYERGHDGTQLARFLGRGDQVPNAQRMVRDLIRDVLVEVEAAGQLRSDVSTDELAEYCVHALTAASSLRSNAAVHRLVTVTLSGLSGAD